MSPAPRAFCLFVLTAWLWSPSPGRGEWVEFQDESAARLSADPEVGLGDSQEKDYAWADVDQDGDIDLVCVRKQEWTTTGRYRNVLFLNEGGVLVDRTVEYASASVVPGSAGFLDETNDRDVVLADVNGDDWLDIITATTLSGAQPKYISHPRVYLNQGREAGEGGEWLGYLFDDAERIPTMPQEPRFCSVAAGDVDGDGDLDLYFGDYDQGPYDRPDMDDRLLINNGQGYFTDETYLRMTDQMVDSSFGMAVALEDINSDGVLDIVKDSALTFPQRVSVSYNNPDDEGFFDKFDVAYEQSPYHVTVGDLNQDARPDLVISDDGQDRYLLNQGNGADGLADFLSRPFTYQFGGDDGFGSNSLIADLNNDTFADVLICDVDVDIPGCDRRLHIYRNLGDLPTVTLQEQGGARPWTPQGVHDVAAFDLNGDGWLDLVIGTCSGTEVWINQPPVDLLFSYPDGLPAQLVPDVPKTFRVAVSGTGDDPQPGTGQLYVSVDDGAFGPADMTEEEPNLYLATLPGVPCTSVVRYYVTAESESGKLVSDPKGAPDTFYSAVSSLGTQVILDERFEDPVPAWTVTSDGSLTAGAWERVDPVGTFWPGGSGIPAQPENDFGAAAEETDCFITQQYPGSGGADNNDVDGGPTILTSPELNLMGSDAVISYARWFFCNDQGAGGEDTLVTQVTNGGPWVTVDQTFGTGGAWQVHSFKVSDHVSPNEYVRVRFVADDTPNNSVTEAGIDNFTVARLVCTGECETPADCDDGLFCNGPENCVQGTCEPGEAPCAGLCDEELDACVDCLEDADCTDGLFCNGVETCDGGTCQPGGDPCPGKSCDETTDTCVDCLGDADCDDGLFCNGAETCEQGSCQAGTAPCPNICDEQSDTCVNCLEDADCDDGVFCNGAEVCDGGTCVPGGEPCPGQLCDEIGDTCGLALQPALGEPLPDLTPEQLERFNAGRALFDKTFKDEEGLGPIFNQNSCASCHNNGAAGGSGSISVVRFGFSGQDGFDPLEHLGGSLLQAEAISEECREVVPDEANITAERATPPTFGAGLVESIPDDDILAIAFNQPLGITGRIHLAPVLEDPEGPLKVGRFGWKSQLATVLSFSADASRNEMGFTNRLLPTENAPNGDEDLLAQCDTVPDPEDGPDGEGLDFIDRVTDFQRYLAPPPQTPRSGMRGEEVFGLAGCADCHVASFQTAESPDLEDALRARPLQPYSDFLIHDMGFLLGDGIAQGDADTTEMRTTPLWGLRVRDPLLHDGRVAGGTFEQRVRQAIDWHGVPGSEAAASQAGFDALPPADQQALIAFLDSLGRREYDQTGDGLVDLADYHIFEDCLTGPGSAAYTPDDPCAISDWDQDGDVDLVDYAGFQLAGIESP